MVYRILMPLMYKKMKLSCLGPLLFLIYINDLVAVFDANVTPKLYADDLKLYASLSCSTSIADFQKNLDRLTEWAKTWQLSISVSKCCVRQVGSRHRLRDYVIAPVCFM